MPMTSISLCDLNTKGITTLYSVERCIRTKDYFCIKIHAMREESKEKRNKFNWEYWGGIEKTVKMTMNERKKNIREKRNECDQHLYARVGAMKWTVINGHGSLHEQDDRLWIYVSGNSKSHYHEMWLWTGAQINIYTCAPVNMNLDCFMINWIGFLRHRLNTKLWPQSMFLMLYCILKEVHSVR